MEWVELIQEKLMFMELHCKLSQAAERESHCLAAVSVKDTDRG